MAAASRNNLCGSTERAVSSNRSPRGVCSVKRVKDTEMADAVDAGAVTEAMLGY